MIQSFAEPLMTETQSFNLKGELKPEISLLHMKVLTLIKAKYIMFFFDMCNAVAAREDRKPKYWRLGCRHLGLSLTLWCHTLKCDILNMACDCWFPCSCIYWSLVKARKIVWESHVIDSSSITQSAALWSHNVKLNPRWQRPSR